MTDTVDVEACVRLLTDYRRILKEKLHKCSIRSVCHTPFPCSTCRGICGDIDQVGALASALPGMGKDSARYAALRRTAEDPFYAALEFREILRRNETLDAFADSRIDVWAQRDAIDAAARAAQPKETSADA